MKIFETAKKSNKNPLVEKCTVHEDDEVAAVDVTTDVEADPEMVAADVVVGEPAEVDVHAQFDTVIEQIPAFAEFVATLAAKLAGTDALAAESCSDKKSKKDMVKEDEDEEEIEDKVEVKVDSDDDDEEEFLDAEVVDDVDEEDIIDAELEDEADDVEDEVEDEIEADIEDEKAEEETKDAAEALAELTMQDWLDVLAKID